MFEKYKSTVPIGFEDVILPTIFQFLIFLPSSGPFRFINSCLPPTFLPRSGSATFSLLLPSVSPTVIVRTRILSKGYADSPDASSSTTATRVFFPAFCVIRLPLGTESSEI